MSSSRLVGFCCFSWLERFTPCQHTEISLSKKPAITHFLPILFAISSWVWIDVNSRQYVALSTSRTKDFAAKISIGPFWVFDLVRLRQDPVISGHPNHPLVHVDPFCLGIEGQPLRPDVVGRIRQAASDHSWSRSSMIVPREAPRPAWFQSLKNPVSDWAFR